MFRAGPAGGLCVTKIPYAQVPGDSRTEHGYYNPAAAFAKPSSYTKGGQGYYKPLEYHTHTRAQSMARATAARTKRRPLESGSGQ